jgi:hypothetical protein
MVPGSKSDGVPFHAGPDGVRALGEAVGRLVDDPGPAEGFHGGRYHRVRVGRYRVLYVIDDAITVTRV